MRNASANKAQSGDVTSDGQMTLSRDSTNQRRACVGDVTSGQTAEACAVVAQHKGVAVAAWGALAASAQTHSVARATHAAAAQCPRAGREAVAAIRGDLGLSGAHGGAMRGPGASAAASACIRLCCAAHRARRVTHLQSQRRLRAVLRCGSVERKGCLQRAAAAHPRAHAAAGCLIRHGATQKAPSRTPRASERRWSAGAGSGSAKAATCLPKALC